MWTPTSVRYWCEHYHSLRSYELNPFSVVRFYLGENSLTGSQAHLSPYEETCDLNWEFDRALKLLGDKEAEFLRLYIDGEGGNEELFNQFLAYCNAVAREDN